MTKNESNRPQSPEIAQFAATIRKILNQLENGLITRHDANTRIALIALDICEIA